VHHPAFASIKATVYRIAAIPVGNGQTTTRFQDSQEFVCKPLLIGHMRASFDRPYSVKALILKLEIKGIHHCEATGQRVCC
jgi:hypothetical protein